MADVSGITGVRLTDDTEIDEVTFGATVAVGETVYKDSTDDHKAKLADCDLSAAAAATVGIALTPGTSGDRGIIATGGTVYLVGATLAVGQAYVQSATAGKIAPESDLVASDNVTHLGYGSTANELKLNLDTTGIAHA